MALNKIKNPWYFINYKGETICFGPYNEVHSFYEGFAAVKVADKWGFINLKDEIVIPPQFDEVGNFRNGIALIKLANRFGYCDIHGNVIIAPKYIEAYGFRNERAFVKDENDRNLIIDSSGNEIYRFNEAQKCKFYSEGFFLTKKKNKFGFIDVNGNLAIDFQFKQGSFFREGLAPAGERGAMGYINKNGDWQIEPVYENCHLFHNGVARVRNTKILHETTINSHWTYINKLNQPLLSTNYDISFDFINGYILFGYLLDTIKYGFVDLNQNVLIDKLDGALEFSDGYAPVYRYGKGWGFVNNIGNIAIDFQYTKAKRFSEGLAAVSGNWKRKIF